MFCPKCGSILLPKGGKAECGCGYKGKATSMTLKEKVKPLAPPIEVTEERETNPLTEADCPKCNHPKAYTWEIQTRAGDEPATRFFKCENCKHSWREYK